MNKTPLHPLISKNEDGTNKNAHYDKQKQPTIQRIEDNFTIDEVIAWCKINVFKYTDRAPYKNQSTEDQHKIDKYNQYKEMLQSLLARSQTLKQVGVSEAYKLLDMKWRYS